MPDSWSSRLWYARFGAIPLFRRLSLFLSVWYSYSKFIHFFWCGSARLLTWNFPSLRFIPNRFHGLSSSPSKQQKQQHQQQQHYKKQKTNRETQKQHNPQQQQPQQKHQRTKKQTTKPTTTTTTTTAPSRKTLTINLKINMNHEPEVIVCSNSPPTPAAMHVTSNIAIFTKREKGQHCPSKKFRNLFLQISMVSGSHVEFFLAPVNNNVVPKNTCFSCIYLLLSRGANTFDATHILTTIHIWDEYFCATNIRGTFRRGRM